MSTSITSISSTEYWLISKDRRATENQWKDYNSVPTSNRGYTERVGTVQNKQRHDEKKVRGCLQSNEKVFAPANSRGIISSHPPADWGVIWKNSQAVKGRQRRNTAKLLYPLQKAVRVRIKNYRKRLRVETRNKFAKRNLQWNKRKLISYWIKI